MEWVDSVVGMEVFIRYIRNVFSRIELNVKFLEFIWRDGIWLRI